MESRCNKKENACKWKSIVFLQQRNRKNSHCCVAGVLFKLWLLSWKTLIPQLHGFLRIINDEFTNVHACLALGCYFKTLSYLVYVLHNTVNIEIKLLWSVIWHSTSTNPEIIFGVSSKFLPWASHATWCCQFKMQPHFRGPQSLNIIHNSERVWNRLEMVIARISIFA